MMSMLTFALPDGEYKTVEVTNLLNAGYAGSDPSAVAHHIEELAKIGVEPPAATPALYPLPPYLAQQTDTVHVQHGLTSGEGEWALVICGPHDDDVLLTAASDHTDRHIETLSVAGGKLAAPDVLASEAWRLVDIQDHQDSITISAWSRDAIGEQRAPLQQGTLTELLSPGFWLDQLERADLRRAGTVLLSGTIPMSTPANQYGSHWSVRLSDEATGRHIELGYSVVTLTVPELISNSEVLPA